MEDYRTMLGFTPEAIEKNGPFAEGPEIQEWFEEDPGADPDTLLLELRTLEEEYEMKKSLLSPGDCMTANAASVLVRWYFGLGLYDKAKNICRELVDADNRTNDEIVDGTDDRIVFDYAESLLWSGDVEKGIDLLEKLLETSDIADYEAYRRRPGTRAAFPMDFRCMLALSFGKAGRYSKAAEQFLLSTKNKRPLDPRPPRIRYDSLMKYAYVCCYYLGDTVTAEKAYRQVYNHYTGKSEDGGLVAPGRAQRETSSAAVSALRNYAEFLAYCGRFDEAIEMLRQAGKIAAKDEPASVSAQIDKRISEIGSAKTASQSANV